MKESNIIEFPGKKKENEEKDPAVEAARELNALVAKAASEKILERLQYKFPPPKSDLEDVSEGQIFTANFNQLLEKCNPDREEQLSTAALLSLTEQFKISLNEAEIKLGEES